MNFILLYVLFPGVLLFLLSCGWLNGPDDDVNPRKLTWTIDTLAYPGSFQTMMRRIWGSSPKDIYTVGHNFGSGGHMWHYFRYYAPGVGKVGNLIYGSPGSTYAREDRDLWDLSWKLVLFDYCLK